MGPAAEKTHAWQHIGINGHAGAVNIILKNKCSLCVQAKPHPVVKPAGKIQRFPGPGRRCRLLQKASFVPLLFVLLLAWCLGHVRFLPQNAVVACYLLFTVSSLLPLAVRCRAVYLATMPVQAAYISCPGWQHYGSRRRMRCRLAFHHGQFLPRCGARCLQRPG